MLMNKTRFAAGLAVFTTIMMATACAASDKTGDGKADYTKMSANELAEHLIFEAKGFNLDMPTQEGGTVRDRLVQDDLQKICSETRGKPTPEQVGRITAEARASIKYPEGGIQLGDWQKGRELAWSGFGFRVGHNIDDHANREVGGNCYNCHQMATDRVGGNLGPSLTGFGSTRGDNEGTRRYVYEVIYNAHAYFPCTHMPRMGANGLLGEQAIADIMAYLLDPASPVNQVVP